MRTNIDIDGALMDAAMRAAGKTTKRETVEEALRVLVRQRLAHDELMSLRGIATWEGDLDGMRRSRHVPDDE